MAAKTHVAKCAAQLNMAELLQLLPRMCTYSFTVLGGDFASLDAAVLCRPELYWRSGPCNEIDAAAASVVAALADESVGIVWCLTSSPTLHRPQRHLLHFSPACRRL